MSDKNAQSYERCFACSRPIKGVPMKATTGDGQVVHVGPDCQQRIHAAGSRGYQPPLGGPVLYQFNAFAEYEAQNELREELRKDQR